MNSRISPEWLMTTVTTVRELMIKRLETGLDAESKRDLENVLEELDLMWEELQSQAALLVSESERYAEFFEFAPDAHLITDTGGSIREANQAALELLKAARNDLVGKPLAACVADEDRVAFLARMVDLMPGVNVRPFGWRARLQPTEGEPVAADFSVRAIPLKRSGVGGFCWLIRPVADPQR